MGGLFVAGTDTSVGKTVVTGGIAAYLRKHEFDCGVMKPVESGCLSGSRKSDSFFLKNISQCPDDLDLINTYAFEEPLAPGVAAQIEGVDIDFDRIVENYRRLELLHQHVLVEGVGGLLVPLSGNNTMVDLIQYLELPVLLVARLGLGTINHTLLSLNYLRQNNVNVVGIVLNQDSKNADASTKFNHSTLAQWTRIPIWGVVKHMSRPRHRDTVIARIDTGIGEAIDQYFELD